MYVLIKDHFDKVIQRLSVSPDRGVKITEFYPLLGGQTVLPLDKQFPNCLNPCFDEIAKTYGAMLTQANLSSSPAENPLEFDEYNSMLNAFIDVIRKNYPHISLTVYDVGRMYKLYRSTVSETKISGVLGIELNSELIIFDNVSRLWLPELEMEKYPSFRTFVNVLKEFVPEMDTCNVVQKYVYQVNKAPHLEVSKLDMSRMFGNINNRVATVKLYVGDLPGDVILGEISRKGSTTNTFSNYYSRMFQLGLTLDEAKALLHYHPNVLGYTVKRVRESLKLSNIDRGVIYTVTDPFIYESKDGVDPNKQFGLFF